MQLNINLASYASISINSVTMSRSRGLGQGCIGRRSARGPSDRGGVNGPRSSAVADIKEYVRSGDHGTETRGLSSCGGVGLMAAGRSFATSPSEDITRRLAQAQQDGKVDGLHTLLVSQGGKLVTEHYGRGEDEAWGHPLGTRHLRASRSTRPALGV